MQKWASTYCFSAFSTYPPLTAHISATSAPLALKHSPSYSTPLNNLYKPKNPKNRKNLVNFVIFLTACKIFAIFFAPNKFVSKKFLPSFSAFPLVWTTLMIKRVHSHTHQHPNHRHHQQPQDNIPVKLGNKWHNRQHQELGKHHHYPIDMFRG